jgi:hypothetical protein
MNVAIATLALAHCAYCCDPTGCTAASRVDLMTGTDNVAMPPVVARLRSRVATDGPVAGTPTTLAHNPAPISSEAMGNRPTTCSATSMIVPARSRKTHANAGDGRFPSLRSVDERSMFDVPPLPLVLHASTRMVPGRRCRTQDGTTSLRIRFQPSPTRDPSLIGRAMILRPGAKAPKTFSGRVIAAARLRWRAVKDHLPVKRRDLRPGSRQDLHHESPPATHKSMCRSSWPRRRQSRSPNSSDAAGSRVTVPPARIHMSV